MILSVSRRTDIPSYYSDWFLERIREGFLYVQNPMNPHQISRIELSPHVVDCMVFWTKNPIPMLGRLEELKSYAFYFQFTLTGYGRDVEPNLPDKRTRLIPAFQELSKKLGRSRVIWRYDPILFSDRYTARYHIKAFTEIAECLDGYTDRVVISFLDLYAKTRKNMAGFRLESPPPEKLEALAGEFVQIAGEHGMIVETCAEQMDLTHLGIHHGSCIDGRLIEKLIGCSLKAAKDKNQRKECGCVESIDVGAYDTCLNGCRYCYANDSDARVKALRRQYDVHSPLLCGVVGPDDQVTERKVKSLKDGQMELF